MNPAFRSNVARSLALLSEEDALLSEMAQAFVRDFAELHPHEVRFDRHMMGTLSRPMARRVVHTAIRAAFPEASRLEFAHIETIVDGLADDAFARDLPERLRAFSEYSRMVIARGSAASPSVLPILLEVPGSADAGASGRIRATECAPHELGDDPACAFVDADKLSGDPLVIDSPREGDRMRPLGMTGTKKLSDLLTDAKVPRRRRAMLPVVRDGDKVVWVAGVRLSEEFKVSATTKRVVRLDWEE